MHLSEGFFDLGAQGFGFEDAGANVGGEAELCGGGALVKLGLLGLGEAKGDAGGFALLLAGCGMSGSWNCGVSREIYRQPFGCAFRS